MADDKTKRGARDRSTVSAEEKYEVNYLMQALKIGRDDAEQLILKYNGNRQRIEQEVSKRKHR
ncbi:DUF3606 domain-containing protein [Phyllobacterium endophyticum]|uniref:DUF3606 domain-containing protein n=1 Tax=Phyllobacterium endophyticum TaxID=1149773 RepID=A0A2P7AUS4_9HYPH|nr:DUF3606 domain-containing protein [Phyllobacterium endophyticum]MBB3234482.1 hypothetical protein [Phyllobacterium endophyticum]PSH57980.1 DUF3606 domain-containing protein [Phyllobacterium endophyticum]TYR39500.1 DUF3606 domain-containing protein [Phyllobacterium endophyticum]